MEVRMDVYVNKSTIFISVQRVVNFLTKYRVLMENMNISYECHSPEAVKINLTVNGEESLIYRAINKIERLVDVKKIQMESEEKFEFKRVI